MKIEEFFKEAGGEFSSRRLVFVLGSIVTIPTALIIGALNVEKLPTIVDSILIYLGSSAGFSTVSKVMGSKAEVKK